MPSQELLEWRRAGKAFDFAGHQVFYRDTGNGETVLLIHGFPTASWDWHSIWDDLAKQYRLVAPDMLGFGFSDKPANHSYSIFEQADLHQQLSLQLGIERCHLLVHDYGVSVAQELLARQHDAELPWRIESIAFLNGGLFPESHQPRLIQKMLLSPVGPMISRLMNYGQFCKSFSAVFGPETQPTESELQDFWYIVSQADGHRRMHRLIRYMIDRRVNRQRWLKPMQQTEVPMRIINGPLDPVSGEHLAKRYCELIPNPDYVSIPGIGHYPQVESPRAVLDAYRSFRNKL